MVLRLGHRKERDKRVTTHVCLTARALGADGVILSGERDDKIIATVKKVAENWGGKFSVKYEGNWKRAILGAKKKRFAVAHLTMYGERLQDVVKGLRKKRNLLVVVGAEKVPSDVYSLADFNVAVGSQPHSEVAALAVFLNDISGGRWQARKFPGARLRIVPQARGKKVLRRGK